MNMRHKARQKGLTLVEMMIAITLSLILTVAVGFLYVGTKQTYRSQESLSRLQENARYALEVISRDVRMAGYRGCAGSTNPFANTLNTPTAYPWNFAVPIQGFESTGASTWSPALDASITSPLGGSDVITVRSVQSDGVPVVAHASPTGDITVNAGSGLQQWEVALAASCTNSAVFQITNVPGTTVSHAATGAAPGNATANLGAIYTGGEVIPISTKTYYLRSNPAGRPALYRIEANNAAEELVENVAGMQIAYGEDTNGDSAIDAYNNANAVGNWGNVLSVRISLLVNTAEDSLTPQAQDYTFNGATVTAPDRRLYKVFTETIGIRNRLP
jgi:type IV pilus assembly protein PilW